MIRKFACIACAVTAFFAACAPQGAESVLIPAPREQTFTRGEFDARRALHLSFETEPSMADALTDYLATTSLAYERAEQKAEEHFLHFAINENAEIPASDEGYVLDITENGVQIEARTEAGLFYGLQSFVQLRDAGEAVIPAPHIVDARCIAHFQHQGVRHQADADDGALEDEPLAPSFDRWRRLAH